VLYSEADDTSTVEDIAEFADGGTDLLDGKEFAWDQKKKGNTK